MTMRRINCLHLSLFKFFNCLSSIVPEIARAFYVHHLCARTYKCLFLLLINVESLKQNTVQHEKEPIFNL